MLYNQPPQLLHQLDHCHLLSSSLVIFFVYYYRDLPSSSSSSPPPSSFLFSLYKEAADSSKNQWSVDSLKIIKDGDFFFYHIFLSFFVPFYFFFSSPFQIFVLCCSAKFHTHNNKKSHFYFARIQFSQSFCPFLQNIYFKS